MYRRYKHVYGFLCARAKKKAKMCHMCEVNSERTREMAKKMKALTKKYLFRNGSNCDDTVWLDDLLFETCEEHERREGVAIAQMAQTTTDVICEAANSLVKQAYLDAMKSDGDAQIRAYRALIDAVSGHEPDSFVDIARVLQKIRQQDGDTVSTDPLDLLVMCAREGMCGGWRIVVVRLVMGESITNILHSPIGSRDSYLELLGRNVTCMESATGAIQLKAQDARRRLHRAIVLAMQSTANLLTTGPGYNRLIMLEAEERASNMLSAMSTLNGSCQQLIYAQTKLELVSKCRSYHYNHESNQRVRGRKRKRKRKRKQRTAPAVGVYIPSAPTMSSSMRTKRIQRRQQQQQQQQPRDKARQLSNVDCDKILKYICNGIMKTWPALGTDKTLLAHASTMETVEKFDRRMPRDYRRTVLSDAWHCIINSVV